GQGRSIRERQQVVERDEFRAAVRGLLMTPLMSPTHAEFAMVRRHAEQLRDWFTRETGWILHVERDGARLYKRPVDVTDATRGLRGYGSRPLRIVVSRVRRAGTCRPTDHAARARRAHADPCGRADAGR